MTVQELVEDFHNSEKTEKSYAKLSLKRLGICKDVYSSMSQEQLYCELINSCKVSEQELVWLENILSCNPILKLRLSEIYRWVLRGLTLEESVIRAEVHQIMLLS